MPNQALEKFHESPRKLLSLVQEGLTTERRVTKYDHSFAIISRISARMG